VQEAVRPNVTGSPARGEVFKLQNTGVKRASCCTMAARWGTHVPDGSVFFRHFLAAGGTHKVMRFFCIGVCLLLIHDQIRGQAPAQAAASGVKITVIQGEGTVNNIRKRV
jgi:hypothetical protein